MPAEPAKVRVAETVLLVVLIAYSVLAAFAYRYAYFDWDLALAWRLQLVSLPGFDTLMLAVSFLGNGWVPWLLTVAAGLSLIKIGLRVEGLVCMTGTGLGWSVNLLLKLLIGRPRPAAALVRIAGEYSYESFPSGHVVFFVEFLGFLFFLAFVLQRPGWTRRVTLIVLGSLISLVGLSRVYLGAHWPSDVIGAYLAGAIWLTVMIEAYRRLKARR